MRRDPRTSSHLATISHDGLFWDAYLELDNAQHHPVRGRIAFSAAGDPDLEPVRTAVIFIEDTAQDVLARARDFKSHQLVALLRSCIPEEPQQPGTGGSAPGDD